MSSRACRYGDAILIAPREDIEDWLWFAMTKSPQADAPRPLTAKERELVRSVLGYRKEQRGDE